MSEESMVERVATAIKNAGTPERWSFSDIIFDAFDDRYHDEAMTDVSVALARVAIEAMREPTDAMVIGGGSVMGDSISEVTNDDCSAIFSAMIDAALKETA